MKKTPKEANRVNAMTHKFSVIRYISEVAK